VQRAIRLGNPALLSSGLGDLILTVPRLVIAAAWFAATAEGLFPPGESGPPTRMEALKQKPMAVQRLGHVALRVEEHARATAFYPLPSGSRSPEEADDWT